MDEELLVTWIAPVIPDPAYAPLGWLNELGGIQRIPNVRVTTLTGDKITLDDVAKALIEPCHVLVWSGHGAPGGLLLPSGMVRNKWFATQVSRSSRPRVVVLAACGSQLRDADLHSLTETICRTGINAIGFPASADDAAAARFTVEFIRAMSVSEFIARAFDVAMESISGESTANGVFLTPGIVDIPWSMQTIILEMTTLLQEIRGMLQPEITVRSHDYKTSKSTIPN